MCVTQLRCVQARGEGCAKAECAEQLQRSFLMINAHFAWLGWLTSPLPCYRDDFFYFSVKMPGGKTLVLDLKHPVILCHPPASVN